MVRIRRFGVIRTATVAAVMYLVVSAIFLIPIALVLLAVPPSTDQFGRTVSGAQTAIVFVILPLFYAAFGWIFTAIMCLVYNLAARWTGGIEFEAIAVAAAPPAAAPPPAAPPPTYQPPAGTTPPPGTPEAT
jgi:hypothetical protein